MADDANQPELVPEDVLADRLAIPVKKLRAQRPPGVVVTHAGVFWPLALAQTLAAGAGLVLTLPEKIAPPSEVEELVVASIARGADGRHFPNKTIISAQRTNGQLVLVKVVDSSKYRQTLRDATGKPKGRPMILKARPPQDGNVWSLVGREPRWPGQWLL